MYLQKKIMFVYVQLATYINDLLYRYECVIIPGFGAFLTHYKSAAVDDKNNTFYPPSKVVSFNKQLQTNDGLLANHVSSSEQCSYEVALQRIRNFAGSLSLKLYNGEKVVLDKIGTFSLNEEKNIQFQPLEFQNYNTSSFGLSNFVSTPIHREAYKETSEKLEEKTPLLFTPERRSSSPYLKYAAIGLIAIAVSGLAGFSIYKKGVENHNFAEKQKANTLLENEIQEATFVIENPLPALTVAIPKPTGKYHIIAGAFRFEENASKKIEQLNQNGFNARSIGKNKYGLHQVVYKSFENRLEAIKSLQQIKSTINKDAWLLVQELK